ncbi:MAG: SGNH/GDSL hydrolase family protein [Candidatus Humimicrobiaceae bacterium]
MKTIFCYGDSNTYGCKPIGFDILEENFIPVNERYSIRERWTGILQQELGEGYRIIEEGLNGRTTVFDDPIEGNYRNGKSYLLPCLESHAPIDLVLLMLGTNDLKLRFSVSAFDIAAGVGALVDIIKASGCGNNGRAPQVLILCPPPLGKITNFSEMFLNSLEKSKKLSQEYRKVAGLKGCHFLDVGKIIKPSDIDGVHYDLESHKRLGQEIARFIKNL